MNVKNIIFLVITTFLLMMISLPNLANAASKMPDGTKVGNLNIEHQSDEEINMLLETEIANWKSQDELKLVGEFDQYLLTREVFQFDVTVTISEVKNKTKRSLRTFFQRPKNIQVPLTVAIDETNPTLQTLKQLSYIDYDNLLNQLRFIAEQLGEGTIGIQYVEGVEIPLETIVTTEMELTDVSDATINYLIEQLNGYVLKTGEIFSFLHAIESPERLINSSDETSFIATGLYTLFLQTNMDIVERNVPLMEPTYGEKGMHVVVNKREEKDLIIQNNEDFSYQINVLRNDKTIQFSLEGKSTNRSYEIEIENETEIEPKTIYRYSKTLLPGEEQIIHEGKKGYKMDVYRSTYEQGVYLDSELISKDYYLPEPRIVLVSSRAVEEETVDDLEDIEIEDELAEDAESEFAEYDAIQLQDLLDERLNTLIETFFLELMEENNQLKNEQTDTEEKIAELEKEIEELIKRLSEFDRDLENGGEQIEP